MDDWRLLYQMDYLYRAKLKKATFRPSETNEHEHCEFCRDKFAEYEGCLKSGYCTLDEYRWICETCFEDFKEQFEWTVVETPGESEEVL